MRLRKDLPVALLAGLLAVGAGCEAGQRGEGSDAEPARSVQNRDRMAAADAEPPRPNARMQQVLDELAALDPKPIPQLSAEEARRQPTPADAVKALLKKEGQSTDPMPVGKVEDRTIPGAAGEIPARIYTPKGEGPHPVTLYMHGGGWVIATIDTYDSSARALTNAANTIIVSIEYRKGPEHKFPAAHDDAFAAYKWLTENAGQINGDPKRIAVAGESAGGNLAAAVALRARDEKAPMPVHQLLVYPIAGYDFETPSYQRNADAKPLNRDMMKWFFDQYLSSPADAQRPWISLVDAENLGKLPPATVVTAEIDPLMSEGRAYADKLKAAGVNVRHRNFDGVAHEFFGMGAVLPEAKQAVQFAAEGLKSSF